MFRHAVLSLLLLPALAGAMVPQSEGGEPGPAVRPSSQPRGGAYLLVGGTSSIAGQGMYGQPDVKPYHNARKYGLNRGLADMHPGSNVTLGYQSGSVPFFVEMGVEEGHLTYESASLSGTVLVNNTVNTQVASLTLAPGLRLEDRNIGLSLGCRLGWSNLMAQRESATPTSLLGKQEQRSDIFCHEPFVRLDVRILEFLSFGVDAGYAARNFWQISNTKSEGVYSGAPAVEKNPDGTDTSVDLSGATGKVFVGVIF